MLQKFNQIQYQFDNQIFTKNRSFQMLCELEKKNISKLLQKFSLQHLRPSPQVYEINISRDQLFFKGSDKRRRIYYKVDYEKDQIERIQQLKAKFQEQKFSHPFGDQVLLKHLYSSKQNIDKTFDRIKLLLEYNTTEKYIRFDDQTIKQLQSGKAYCYGHDRGMRPNVIFRMDKFDLEKPFQDCLNLVYYLMLTVMGFKMVPYHAQKYNMIIDLNNMSITDIPYMYLYDCVFKLSVFYCFNAQKTFIYNSEGISTIWKIVSFFLEENQRKRVIFINKGEEKEILEHIDPYELEKKYGGKLPNLTTYWPPKNTNEQFDINFNKNNASQSFYSVQNDEQFFGKEDQTATIGCQCTIF